MEIVNVGRSWSGRLSEAECRDAIAGDWPFRPPLTVDGIRRRADYVAANHRGRIVRVYKILDVEDVGDQRVRYQLGDCDDSELEQLTSMPAPQLLRWRRGELWPIRHVPTDDVRIAIEEQNATRRQAVSGRIAVGDYHVEIDDAGNLLVLAPIGRPVLVRPVAS